MSEKRNVTQVLTNIELVIAGVSLVTIIAITFGGVVFRYFLNAPIMWLEEVQLWCFVWVTFFGAAAAFKAGSHVAIDILYDILPKKAQLFLDWFGYAVVMGVLIFLAFYGAKLMEQLSRTERLSNILQVPYAFIYSAMPIGCVLMMISLTVVHIEKLKKARNA